MGQKKDSERKIDISVVIPVYGCPGALPDLYKRLKETLKRITDRYEIILVNDACPYHSWDIIKTICEEDKNAIGMNMSRNFGQIKAITAGLDISKGEYVVVMDCDLQDRPESIIELYKKLQEGYDVVFARREGRKDNFITKFLSKCFYRLYGYFTEDTFDSSICNFSISKRKVINAYCYMREQNRAYTMFIRWIGFKQTAIDMPADKRFEGKSSYNFRKKLKIALEIITSQSNRPLILSIKIGFDIALIALCYIIYIICKYLMNGDVLVGWTSLIASIYFIGGMLLCAIGVVGIYVGNIFDETKHRPLYVISEYINREENY